jgi:5-methylcytosine-specific restriction endonuclease McrA
MLFPSLSHLGRNALLKLLRGLSSRHRALTAELLHALAEADRRHLWAEAGYPSMYAWCMGEFGLSEDMAARRICAARLSRRYPGVLAMVADGRLHLSGILALAPKIKEAPELGEELLAAAANKSRRHIEHMLAERFPLPDVATTLTPLPAPARVESPATSSLPAPGPAKDLPAAPSDAGAASVADAAAVETHASGPPSVPTVPTPAYSSIAPTAPQRYKTQFTMDEAMHSDLQRAMELLGPQAGEDRVREVFRRALRVLVTKLEKQKFAATEHPRAPRGSSKARHIPAAIKREVWKRDQGRCVFVSESGRVCESRTALEYDHIEPVARGGRTEARNLRLLCRAHNQLAAEIAFGKGFMHEIRGRARRGNSARISPRGVEGVP